MKKQTSHKLSIKRWVILTLIFGFVATAGAVIIDIDYSMRQLKNETAAQDFFFHVRKKPVLFSF